MALPEQIRHQMAADETAAAANHDLLCLHNVTTELRGRL